MEPYLSPVCLQSNEMIRWENETKDQVRAGHFKALDEIGSEHVNVSDLDLY